MDTRYTDQLPQHRQRRSGALGRLAVAGRLHFAGWRLHLSPHFQLQSGRTDGRSARPLQVRSRTPRGQSVAAPFHEMAPFRYRRFGRCELYALRDVGLLGRIGTLRQWRLASGSRSRTVDAVTDVHRPLLYIGSAGQQSESQTRTSCHLPYRRRLRHRKMACLRTVLLPRRSQCNRLGVARRTDDRIWVHSASRHRADIVPTEE